MTPALSILQPWAWLIVHGFKDIENRVWRTEFRGRFLVHAGKGFDQEGYDELLARRLAPLWMPKKDQFERGGIVGEARLVDCVVEHPSPWFVGPYGFVLDHRKPLPFRPLRGQLNFFGVPDA